ncbi:MAG: GAF domain-containing protein, partial [Anaerolineae bacterium]
KALVATLDLEAVHARIVEAVTYLTLAPSAHLLLRDAESGELHQVARRDKGDKYARTLLETVEDDVAAEAMRSGSAKLLRASQDASGARHRLDVPLLSSESPIGVLSVLSDDDNRPFTNHDQYLLEHLAEYAVVALENARLVNGLLSAYEELRQPERETAPISADRPLSVAEVGARAAPETEEGAAERETDSPEPGAVDQSLEEEEAMAEVKVGTITHYYGKIGVAIVDLESKLSVGDTVHIVGHTSDFTQEVDSMQIEHEDVEEAKAGQSIGLKVDQRTRQNDEVFRES